MNKTDSNDNSSEQEKPDESESKKAEVVKPEGE